MLGRCRWYWSFSPLNTANASRLTNRVRCSTSFRKQQEKEMKVVSINFWSISWLDNFVFKLFYGSNLRLFSCSSLIYFLIWSHSTNMFSSCK
jgi:hypothetical protein